MYNIKDDAVREVREETGQEVLLGPLFTLRSETGEPVVLAVYSATPGEKAPVPSRELSELRWFDPRDLPPMAFEHDAAVLAAWWESRRGDR